MNPGTKILGGVLFLGITLQTSACKNEYATSAGRINIDEASQHLMELQKVKPEEATVSNEYAIKQGSNAFDSLKAAGLDAATAQKLVDQARPVYPLERVRAGTPFKVFLHKTTQKLHSVEITFSLVETLLAQFHETSQDWTVELIQHPIQTETVTFSGDVNTSLWDSGLASGMDARLISDFADIFAWQVDFSREVQPGDRWRLTVEKKSVDGAFYEWGFIKVAEYHPVNGPVLTGVRFPQDDPQASYYDLNGASLKRMFLKSPIQYARITSGFSKRRFHPVLKVNRPHNGVDYGAKPGTPVMAVGDGQVVSASFGSDTGNIVRIRHNSVYETAYLHLQGFASGVRKGNRVVQGQTIGYVGSTGLATGPHLHFSFFENGRFVDPLGMKFPSADPVAAEQLSEFKRLAQEVLVSLPSWKFASN